MLFFSLSKLRLYVGVYLFLLSDSAFFSAFTVGKVLDPICQVQTFPFFLAVKFYLAEQGIFSFY